MLDKNTSSLEGKPWYRFLKVVYIIIYVLTLLISGAIGSAFSPYTSTDIEDSGYFFMGTMIGVLIMYGIKVAFFYVIKGSEKKASSIPWYKRVTSKMFLFAAGVTFSLSNMFNADSQILGLGWIALLVCAWVEYGKEKKRRQQDLLPDTNDNNTAI